jgi:peptide/nickel transport system substrate-binding protein
MPTEREFMALTSLMFESLVTLDDDYMPQPGLAQRWESAPDGSSWTFTLREGVVFHDGTPFTSADVVATVGEILRLAGDEASSVNVAYASLKFFVNNISAPDERTVVIKTNRRNFGFLYAMTFPILPAAYAQADIPPGTGPYVAERFEPGDSLWLSVNSSWWGGRPAITEISTLFHATDRELVSSYEYNRVDAILTRSMTAAQYRSGVQSFNLGFRTKQFEALLFNHRSYELSDVRVRKAIRSALNLDGICDSAYLGMARRTDTPMPAGTWTYRADDEVFRQDVAAANALLDEAGWKDSDGDGVRDMVKDGKSVKLSLRFYVYEEQDNSVRANAAAQIAAQLMAVGVEARLNVMSYQEVGEKLRAGSYDLAIASFNMDNTPDPGFLLISGNTANFMRYASTEMDDLFKVLRAAMGRDAYQAALFQIQDRFAQDCPFVALWYRGGAILTRVMFTSARDIRAPDILRGIEASGN